MVPEDKVIDVVYRLWLLNQNEDFSISLISDETGLSRSTIASWFHSTHPPVMRWDSYYKAMSFLIKMGVAWK